MIAASADTHTVIWYLYNDARLSSSARKFLETTASNGDQIGISSITFVEIIYLIEKRRIVVETLSVLTAAMGELTSIIAQIPLDLRLARSLSRVSATPVPDMPDRIIAATAVYLNVPVISRDSKIQASRLTTIW